MIQIFRKYSGWTKFGKDAPGEYFNSLCPFHAPVSPPLVFNKISRFKETWLRFAKLCKKKKKKIIGDQFHSILIRNKFS